MMNPAGRHFRGHSDLGQREVRGCWLSGHRRLLGRPPSVSVGVAEAGGRQQIAPVFSGKRDRTVELVQFTFHSALEPRTESAQVSSHQEFQKKGRLFPHFFEQKGAHELPSTGRKKRDALSLFRR
jgi:hypothetical protein